MAPHTHFVIQAGILQYLGYYGLSISASHFFSSAKPNTNFDTFNVWQEASFGFDKIPLDKTKLSIPPECQPENNQLFPVLVLENNSNNRIISFDPNLYMNLKAQDLLQAQILVSRLWLSEFTDDDDLIFEINQLWYRKGLLKEPQNLEQLKKLFQQLLLSEKRSDSICERSQYILRALQRVLRKNCDQITGADLARVIEIDIQDKDRNSISFDEFELRKIDLAGLTQLKKIIVHDVYWFGISLLEGFFANAPQLQHLDLENVTLDKLRRQQLPVSQSLLSLSIDDSNLLEIQADAFENVFSKDPTADIRMIFSHGYLEHFDSTQIIGLENLKQISLKNMLVSGVLDLSKLNALEVLDLERTRNFYGVLRADHPHLKKLVLSSTMTRDFKVEGPWPQLEYLDASNYTASHFPPALWFHGFPNLKSLNVSYNSLTVPNGQSPADSVFRSSFILST
ncbi:MAG: hypothetical protein IPM97_07855 [Bdellovibrionaceae bacterium]|nr:hypothetical protein [Pseudobdellovibrionaceae bacterium]